MLTRAEVETAEVSRTRDALTLTNRSTVTDGTNPDLNEPIARALGLFGVHPASRSNVTNADLARIDDGLEEQFLDFTEIVVLETCFKSLMMAPQSTKYPHYSVDYGQAIQMIPVALKELRATYVARYYQQGGVRVGILRDADRHKLRLRHDYDWICRADGFHPWDDTTPQPTGCRPIYFNPFD